MLWFTIFPVRAVYADCSNWRADRPNWQNAKLLLESTVTRKCDPCAMHPCDYERLASSCDKIQLLQNVDDLGETCNWMKM